MRCTIFCDAACVNRPGFRGSPMRIGYLIQTSRGKVVAKVGMAKGLGTANRAEYLAIIEALKHALRLGFTGATVNSDSQLAINQLLGRYRIKDAVLERLSRKLKRLARYMPDGVSLNWVRREENAEADSLARSSEFWEADMPPTTYALPLWQPWRMRKWAEMEPDWDHELAEIFLISRFHLRDILRNVRFKMACESELIDWDNWDGSLVQKSAPAQSE